MRAQLNRWTIALLLPAVFCVPQRAAAQGAETVIDWNRALLTTLATPGATDPTVFFSRPMSMLHVAIFEALNSIDRVYTPYIDFVDAAPDASPDAAAAQAARDVLVAIYPSQQPIYDALLATQLGRLPRGPAESGSRVGAAAARAIVAARASDGWNRRSRPFCCRLCPVTGNQCRHRTPRPRSHTIRTSHRS